MRNPYTWLITDTHFNDDAMLTIGRPAGYERKIIANCRSLLAPQDVLIHLGDVIFSRPGELKDYLSKIPAQTKILVRGNHDRQKDSWYIGQGFSFVCDSLGMGDVYLTHIPVALPAGMRLNVHGHLHNFPMERWEDSIKVVYNVKMHKLLALEATDYRPVKFEEFVNGT